MGKDSKIGWTHHTMKFWWECDKVSDECRLCYIDGIMRRAGFPPFRGPLRTVNWKGPFGWNRQAVAAGERHRVLTCSMSDFFHSGADPWRAEAWEVIRQCEHLDWLVLTKRPELALERLRADWGDGYPNVWLGVTCGCSNSLWRVEQFREIPARVKFVSAEPLLQAIDFHPYLGWLDWIITGCERAAKGKRRPMDIDWVRDVDRQCQEAGVAHYFKQAYADEKGVPSEEPLLDGQVTQRFPLPMALVPA